MEGLTVKELELINSFEVSYNSYKKQWKYRFSFNIKSSVVSNDSEYYKSFDEAATAAKAKAAEVVREFNK